MEIKTILAFDIDGTLTKPNDFKITNGKVAEILKTLHQLGHIVVPVTGKSINYAENVLEANDLKFQGVISENGAVYKKEKKSETIVYGGNLQTLNKIRALLGLKKDQEGLAIIKVKKESNLSQKTSAVVIEEGKQGVLTLFTESFSRDPKASPSLLDGEKLQLISKRWPDFISQNTREEIYEYLQWLIKNHNLEKHLHILEPHSDGAIDVLRIHHKTKQPINKSLLTEILKEMYNQEDLAVAMFGDGSNDIPALTADNVFAITFSNCDEVVKRAVKAKNKLGYVTKNSAPEDTGVLEGLLWLAKNNFFKQDSAKIIKLIQKLKI